MDGSAWLISHAPFTKKSLANLMKTRLQGVESRQTITAKKHRPSKV
jgi:hypothetical protein